MERTEEHIYGYARISRKTQSIERQIKNILNEYPDACIYQEAYTGRVMSRPEWNKLMKNVRPGDKIVFDSVSRMSRTSDEGVSTYFDLYEKGIELIFLKEHYIDTSVFKESQADRIPLTGADEDEIFKGLNNYFRKLAERQIRIAFDQSEKEVSDLRQRTKEGLKVAKAKGSQVGSYNGREVVTKKSIEVKKLIRAKSKTFGGTWTDNQIIAELNSKNKSVNKNAITRNTYYKYKKELIEEIDAELI